MHGVNPSNCSMPPPMLQILPSTRGITTSKSHKCPCSKFGCYYRYAEIKFDESEGESNEELSDQMVSLFQSIWVASYTQKMTTCILGAARACIEACKRTKVANEHLVHFYDFRLGGNSLPASIILHSLRDRISEVNPRCSLLQMILDEVPRTANDEYELYSACARTECNTFLNQVRSVASLSITESLKLQVHDFPAVEATYTEIGKDLRSQTEFVERLEVKPTMDGFQAKWAIPDMIQGLRSNIPFFTEFVAAGHIWNISIETIWDFKECRAQIQLLLSMLGPSHDERTVKGKVTIYPHDGNRLASMSLVIPESSLAFSTKNTIIRRKFIENLWYQNANKDGSCYLKFDLVLEFKKD